MKNFIPFLIIYVLVHSAQGDSVGSYEGQSKATITSLLTAQGKTFEFITQKNYQKFVDDHKPPVTSIPDPVKVQAKIDLNTKTKTETERLDALIKYLGLDN